MRNTTLMFDFMEEFAPHVRQNLQNGTMLWQLSHQRVTNSTQSDIKETRQHAI